MRFFVLLCFHISLLLLLLLLLNLAWFGIKKCVAYKLSMQAKQAMIVEQIVFFLFDLIIPYLLFIQSVCGRG